MGSEMCIRDRVSRDTERLQGPKLTGLIGCAYSEVSAIYVKSKAGSLVDGDVKTDSQRTAIDAIALLLQTLLRVPTTIRKIMTTFSLR